MGYKTGFRARIRAEISLSGSLTMKWMVTARKKKQFEVKSRRMTNILSSDLVSKDLSCPKRLFPATSKKKLNHVASFEDSILLASAFVSVNCISRTDYSLLQAVQAFIDVTKQRRVMDDMSECGVMQ